MLLYDNDVNRAGTKRPRRGSAKAAVDSRSEEHRDGRYHKVEVKVIPPRSLGIPKLSARWRLGYFAPSE